MDMDDIIERAEAVLRHSDTCIGHGLVRDLVAEVKRLQEAGPWMEHVERQRAMKRERDGGCICNNGPDTDGPDEFCPWHGRRYSELVDIIVRQQAQLNWNLSSRDAQEIVREG
jgi:hypothetical protein